MMQITVENAAAVRELLADTDPDVCAEHLEEFWESWITGEDLQCADREYRAQRLYTYKVLRKLLMSIKR